MIINKITSEDPVIERIILIQETYCKNQTDFATKIGVSKTTLNSMYKRGVKASFTVLGAILSEFTDVSADWLLRGIGQMQLNQEDSDIAREASTNYTITDANIILATRFEEIVRENEKQKQIISEQANTIARLEMEKKESNTYGIASDSCP